MKPGVAVLVLATIVACACPKKQGGTGAGEGSGSGQVTPPPATGCEGVRGKIDALYRAEAQAKEPKRVEEAVADNTAMAMAECLKAPERVAPCIAQAATLEVLETSCMPQLDDEGSEGDTLKQ